MNVMKKMFVNNMNYYKESFMTYKLTYILTMLVTLAMTISYDNESISYYFGKYVMYHLMYFYVCSVCIIWLSEIIFKKLYLKIIGYVVGTIIGIIFSNLAIKSDYYGIYRIIVGYITIVMCVVIYFLIKNLNVKFTKYILDLFQNIFNYTIMYIVINIGITFLLFIFDALILQDSFSFLIVRFQILFLGFYYVTSMLLAFTKKTSHITVFITNMIKYILYPILLIAVFIVYCYLMKIIVTKNMPENVVYSIVAGIFAAGFPTMLMLDNYKKENKFFSMSLKIVSYLLIPLIILQIISLAIKCTSYGMTSTRYMGIIFICFEIASIGMYIYKKKDILDKILLVLAALMFIATLSPINMDTVSIKNQSKRLKEAWIDGKEYDDLTSKEKEKASGAYRYLVICLDEEIDKYLPSYLDKKDLENIYTPDILYSEYDEDDKKYINVYVTNENMNYNIEKYKEFKIIHGFIGKEYKDKKSEFDEKFEERILDIIESEDGKEQNIENLLNSKNIIPVSKNEDVIILEMDGCYVEKDDEFSILNMSYEIVVFKK